MMTEEKASYLAKEQRDKFLSDLKMYDTLLAKMPNQVDLLNQKGATLCGLRRLDECLQCFEKICKFKPKDPDAFFKKGSVLNELKRYEEAIKCFDFSISLNSKHADSFDGKGMSLAKLKDYKRALICFNIAISLDPTNTEAINNRMSAQIEMGQFEESDKVHNRISAEHESSQVLLNNKAFVFAKNHRYKEAIECFDKSMAINQRSREYKDALSGKGEVYSSTKRFKEALEVYTKLYEIEPSAFHLYNKGAGFMANTMFTEALEIFKKVIKMDAKYGKAHGSAGHCAVSLGMNLEAIHYYDRAIELMDKNDWFLDDVKQNRRVAIQRFSDECKDEAQSDDFHQILLRFDL